MMFLVNRVSNLIFCSSTNDDKFLYQNVTEDHNVFVLDDVKEKFVFENIFSQITGNFEVEPKGKAKFIIPFERSPKIGITSNYVLGGSGGSFEARIREFSLASVYNKNDTPEKKFNHLFFEGWNNIEWEKFDCFMLVCIKIYLTFGIKTN